MQKELQFTLSIIGILIIGGVLLHGLWTIRKNGKKQKKARFESRNWDPGFEQEDTMSGEPPIYDDIGLGKARVVINTADEKDNIEVRVAPKTAFDGHDEVLTASPVHDTSLKQAISSETSKEFTPIQEPNIDETDQEGEYKIVKQVEQSNDLDTLPPINDFTDTEEPQLLESFQDKIINIEEINVSDIAVEERLDLALTKESELSHDLLEPVTEDIASFSHQEKQEETLSLEIEEVKEIKNESESAVYSNVVTQPKPEFARPILTNLNLDNSFGQPPEFLLRKNDEQSVEDTQKVEAKDSLSTTTQTPAPEEFTSGFTVDEPRIPNTDFSLNIQEGPKIKLDVDEEIKASEVEKELSFTEQAKRFVRRNKITVGEKIRKDPVLKNKPAADQMRIDFDETQEAKVHDEASNVNASETKTSSSSKSEVSETDVLVLNVRSTVENPIQGASLLPMLLTLGFKFGEHDIFHRHVNTNGKGPILFSLTNMFKPGVFDIDNIENFSTCGLSLFMMLPIEGDAQQVFNMMHNAARKLSEEFGCRILDGNKVGVSKQSMQQYVERIREFERKRINK